MNLLCNAIKSLWTNFYNTCFRNVDLKLRYTVGLILIVAALIFFVLSTKGKKKGEMVNNWFWFWISMISLISGVLYISL